MMNLTTLDSDTLLAFAAILGPEPSELEVKYQVQMDHAQNDNYGGKPKKRSVAEIKADLRWEFAKQLMSRRPK